MCSRGSAGRSGCPQSLFRLHRRPALRRGWSAQRASRDHALGVVSPAALFCAILVNERVVVDGNWVFAAGVTAELWRPLLTAIAVRDQLGA